MKIRLKKNTMLAGGFAAMGSEAEVPDVVGADLVYRGQAEKLPDPPKPKKTKKSRKKDTED